MKNYTYNTFTVDGHEFSVTNYEDEMKVYIKSIHPYDDADYHWALNRNGGDFYVIYIGSPGKKVDTVFGSKEKVARKLLELDKNIESRMSYESKKNNKNESTKDRFTYDEIETIKDVSEIGDWTELIEIIKDKFGDDKDKQDWDEEDWDNFLRNNFGWIDETEPEYYGVEFRDMHTGIHNIFYTDTKENAEQILAYLKELENPDTTVYDDDEITDNTSFIWDEINRLAFDCFEINYRDVAEDGMYDGIYIINHNDATPDIYESLNKESRLIKKVEKLLK